jgi:hypothetical protein
VTGLTNAHGSETRLDTPYGDRVQSSYKVIDFQSTTNNGQEPYDGIDHLPDEM